MNALEAMQMEIREQLEYLHEVKLEEPEENPLFVGSGDSYAAALAAQYASGNRATSCHPMDIVLNPRIADNRKLFIVSASGNTKANLLAARCAQRRGCVTVAVTSNPSSPLARACDRIIHLRYKTAGVPTAGTISFMASMITCLSLAGKSRIPANSHQIYKGSDLRVERVTNEIASMRRSCVILGNGALYPIALYGALKFYEVFGAKAVAYPGEEFCHSPLFSLTRKDAVLIMGAGKDQSAQLDRRLRKEGFSSSYLEFGAKDVVEILLRSTIFIQLLVLKIACAQKINNLYFLRNRRLLKISSDFIYC